MDYGCGDGYLLNNLVAKNINAIGYEPFSKNIFGDNKIPGNIYKTLEEIPNENKYDLITIFEVIEHLTDQELFDFLEFSKKNLNTNGLILVSVPIMIGPAIILKELRRMSLHKRKSDHNLFELIIASIFALAPRRTKKIKKSHKGYDFRKTFKFIRQKYGEIQNIKYLPLPIGTWYGNSQVFFSIKPYKNTKY